MELDTFCDSFGMEFEVLSYVKPIENNKDALCIVCQVEDPEGECWTRYQFKCGHLFHSRCIRHWCGRKDTINCPLCGDIEQKKENRYCTLCNVWGHSPQIDDYRQYCMKTRSPVRMKTKKRKP